MKPAHAAKTAAMAAINPFEELNKQAIKPIFEEAAFELGGFLGSPLSHKPKTLAQEDLKRARDEQKLEEMKIEDSKKSHEATTKILEVYTGFEQKTENNNNQVVEQIEELKAEVVSLANVAGVDTKAHLENTPKKGKTSLQTIKLITVIIRTLRIKAEESKSASELVSQRSNAKRPTGMLAWVSGKQMQIHEQGTLQLQG